MDSPTRKAPLKLDGSCINCKPDKEFDLSVKRGNRNSVNTFHAFRNAHQKKVMAILTSGGDAQEYSVFSSVFLSTPFPMAMRCEQPHDGGDSSGLQSPTGNLSTDEEVVIHRQTRRRLGSLVPQCSVTQNLFKFIEPCSFRGVALGILTSGGDCQGMNAALRAAVRMGLYSGCRVYFINEGYQGMIDDNINEASWESVSGIMQKGGTIIGSARCKGFRSLEGRLVAAKNLVKKGISHLVVIGGDGSLTGANLFRKEWADLLVELLKKKKITKKEGETCAHLNIVGIVGSIDNDFYGTDMTIGTDSALHRIIEAADSITTTAVSHQRCFILEVMGRHCGYLALAAAISTAADWLFIPEQPPKTGWEEQLCNNLLSTRKAGKRLNIIIIAEGAVTTDGKSIKSDYVMNTIKSKLSIDVRVTVLGHVQRGGSPSAFDRILATRQGAEAVLALLEATPSTSPQVIALDGNKISRVPLMDCVERTQSIGKAMDEQNFEKAISLRGASFVRNLRVYRQLNKIVPKMEKETHAYNFLVINIGAPACGVNSAIRAFARIGIANGDHIYAAHNGLEGLIDENVKELDWASVSSWTGEGGSNIGCQKQIPEAYGIGKIAEKMRKYKIHGMLVVGGFEAYRTVLDLSRARKEFAAFKIPMIVLPATISNNVPGTQFSVGTDTALNEISSTVDKIKQSASGSSRRVFVVECMGGYCGYLATMSGLASGADAAYIWEEHFSIQDLLDDVRHLKTKIAGDVQRGIIMRNEQANKYYTTKFIYSLYAEEGKGIFDVRMNVLGHEQQGGMPSPFDRNLGLKFATKSLWRMQEFLEGTKVDKDGMIQINKKDSACVVGLVTKQITFTPVEDLVPNSDFNHRIATDQWWIKLRSLLRILAKNDSVYIAETENSDIR
ncbi:hypothetical protein SNEBB_005683 [Seison nebaliae]|nr:hypothetical protein SNEBB_005683 [Seison nebaliae]